MFTVYNYVNDLRRKEKPRKIKRVIATEQSESGSKSNKKKTCILNSNDSKFIKNYNSNSDAKSERMSVKNDRNIPKLSLKNNQSRLDTVHRGSVKHNFRGNIKTLIICRSNEDTEAA